MRGRAFLLRLCLLGATMTAAYPASAHFMAGPSAKFPVGEDAIADIQMLGYDLEPGQEKTLVFSLKKKTYGTKRFSNVRVEIRRDGEVIVARDRPMETIGGICPHNLSVLKTTFPASGRYEISAAFFDGETDLGTVVFPFEIPSVSAIPAAVATAESQETNTDDAAYPALNRAKEIEEELLRAAAPTAHAASVASQPSSRGTGAGAVALLAAVAGLVFVAVLRLRRR